MAYLEWSPSMSVGMYLIDEQHKELVHLINDIADAKTQTSGRIEISRLIRRFFDYTANHFRAEEALMDHNIYPEYFAHVQQHLGCSQKALDFHVRFMREQEFDMNEFQEYIVRWFVDHTTGIDQTLGPSIQHPSL